jgi:hypothetical protein
LRHIAAGENEADQDERENAFHAFIIMKNSAGSAELLSG